MNKRYERQVTGDGNAAPEVAESQFAAFEQEARKNAEASNQLPDLGKIEDRDKRGADTIEASGKVKPRIPIHEVDNMAEEMAARFSGSVERVTTELGSNALTVTIVTKHGTSKASADVEDWTAAGVKKALADVEEKMNGKSSEEPKDKLAEAVREVAKGCSLQ